FAEGVRDFPSEVRPRVLVDGDMVQVFEADACLAQAIADGLGRETSPMLDPTKALLLRGSDDFAVSNDTRGGVAVESVDAEDCGHDPAVQMVPVSSHRRMRRRFGACPGHVNRGSHMTSALRSIRRFATVAAQEK